MALIDEAVDGEPLLRAAMRKGKRVGDLPSLTEARTHAAASLARLPEPLRRLDPFAVPVEISPGIRQLRPGWTGQRRSAGHDRSAFCRR